MKSFLWIATLGVAAACSAAPVPSVSVRDADAAGSQTRRGWLSWRGPDQNGASPEKGLPDTVTLGGENHLWSYALAGRGTPVVADGHVYALGYAETGPDLLEVLVCLDEQTGERVWEHRFPDFLSDVIYNRYAIGSPTVDPETGNVFAMTAPGLLHAFSSDGEMLWQVSLTETLGRLSFPNGRIGSPLVLEDLVIIHFIFASWGPLGPARDRFFAFDKHTGEVVWSSTPGGPPKDSSFSMPVVEERDGRLLLYAGLGGGHVSCVDARTGDARWRFPLAVGGVNSSALLYGDTLIAIHGKENLDTSTIGRMVALRLDAMPDDDGVLDRDAEVWRNDLVAFTSSPVLVGDRIYQTTQTGELACVDAATGATLWHEKLGPDQLHASPIAADGKLYVPMNNGTFFIVRPGDDGAEILDREQLAGNCLGAPAIANGRIYVHTTDRLYCFGTGKGRAPEWSVEHDERRGEPVRLQIVPADVTARVGEAVPFRVRRLDDRGRIVDELSPSEISFENPPGVTTNFAGAWTLGRIGAGVSKAVAEGDGGLAGTARLRTVPALPYVEDFEGIELDKGGGEHRFAFPPGNWFGGPPKWRVREIEGGKVVARHMENPLFQRTMSLFGHPDDAGYTLQADVMSDGNRRSMSSVGLVNQRYLIALKGNYQTLEVSSNMERLKVSVPFPWKAKAWYTLKTRVDVAPDGSGIVRAKVWPRGESEPDAWTLEVPHANAHRNGAAGVYGFTPQSRFTVYLDNITVTPNE